MNPPNSTKFQRLRQLLLAVIATVCLKIAYSQGMESVPAITVWIAVTLFTIASLSTLVYAVFKVRRFRLSTLMLLIPVPAALLAMISLPYFRHWQMVDQFNRAGIGQFRLEPAGYESILELHAYHLTGAFPGIFATKWMDAFIDIDECNPSQLINVSSHPNFVYLGNRDDLSKSFSNTLIDWINRQPRSTEVLIGLTLRDADIPSLKRLRRPVRFHLSVPSSPSQFDFLCSIESQYVKLFDDSIWLEPSNSSLSSGQNDPTATVNQSSDARQHNAHVRQLAFSGKAAVDTAWLVELCDCKTVEVLKQFDTSPTTSLSIADCSRLARLPKLRHVELVGLDRACLLQIAQSEFIRYGYFHNCKLSEEEIVEVREAFNAKSIKGELIFQPNPKASAAITRRIEF